MIRRFNLPFLAFLALADMATAFGVVVMLSVARYGDRWVREWDAQLPHASSFLLLFLISWAGLLWSAGLYRPRARWTFRREALAIGQAAASLGIASFGILYLLHLSDISRLFLVALFPCLAAGTISLRAGEQTIFQVLRRRGRNLRNVVVAGTGQMGLRFAATLESHPELGLRIEGFIGNSAPDLPARWPYLGDYSRTLAVLHSHVVDEVVVCLPLAEWDRVEAIARAARNEGKIVRLPLELPNPVSTHGYVEELEGLPVLSLANGADRELELAFKRLIDLIGAAVGLIALSPILLAAAITIWISDGRPVLFRQQRAGLNGRPFSIVKFRTMTRDADSRRAELRELNEVKGGASFKMTDDPRITRVGRWLRRTSIDELPQLWNVLRGEMSLVGPRPHPFDDVAGYDAWHRRRLSVKPGVTGLWQIGARRDDDFDHWVSKDLEYIDHWSLWLDIRVLVSTIPALLRAEGR